MKNKRQCKTAFCAGYFGDYENDTIGLLAAEVVIHAVADWRELVKARAWTDELPKAHCNFNELRAFFKSEWCDFIMHQFDMSPEALLALLKEELAEAQRLQPRKKDRKG